VSAARKGRREPLPPTPTDSEAAAGAQTQAHPHNLEEQEMASRRPAAEPVDTGETVQGTQPIPQEQPASLLERTIAAATTGFCPKCNTAAVPDPKGVHKCARCRSEVLEK